MDFPQGFAGLLDAPKGDQRLAAGFIGRHACGDILLNLLLQMETEFFIRVVFLAFTTRKDVYAIFEVMAILP